MKTDSFTRLIGSITGRPFAIAERTDWRNYQPASEILGHEKTYFVHMALPLTGRVVGFDWKTPKADEKMLRSFITAFASKYREPDPATYACYDGGNRWEAMTDEQRESAYGHHALHMLSKAQLLAQVEARFACADIETALNQWGFYETEYGIGIFCYWETQFVRNAIARMRGFLSGLGVSAFEEYSDARWVYRFRVEATREIHASLIGRFTHLSDAR